MRDAHKVISDAITKVWQTDRQADFLFYRYRCKIKPERYIINKFKDQSIKKAYLEYLIEQNLNNESIR